MLGRIPFALGLALLGLACAAPPAAEERGTHTSRQQGGCPVTPVTEGQLAQMLRSAGFDESAVGPMVCIAEKESTFCPTASNGKHRGLFQVDPNLHVGKPGCPDTAAGLDDPQANVACAKALFDESVNAGRSGFQPWSTRGKCEGAAAPESSGDPLGGLTDGPMDPALDPLPNTQQGQPQPMPGDPGMPYGDWPYPEDPGYPGYECPYGEDCYYW